METVLNSLVQGSADSGYGDEAISVLLKQMEDNRGKFCVIFAGYKEEMQTLLKSNPGLTSRIQFSLDFPDYSSDELSQIAKMFLQKKHYTIDGDALELVLKIMEYYRKRPDFANARTLRNVLEQVIMNQNLRTDELDRKENSIILSDVQDYIEDEGIDLSSNGSTIRKIGF